MAATIYVEYHDDTRQVITRQDGEEPSRPYTADENAAADLRNDRINNEASLTADSIANLDVLLASITSLKTVTDKANAEIGPGDTKTVARESRRAARQVVRITRLLLDASDTTDAGTE